MFGQPPFAVGIAFADAVSATIDFDDEPFLPTTEIDDVGPDRLLTHKFESAERA